MAEPVTLIDFRQPGSAAEWRAVNDGVMGGLSDSRLRLSGRGTALFEGRVSLENNGGFASVRRAIAPLALAGVKGIALRARGDGQRYRLRLHLDPRFDSIAYQAEFSAAESWQTIRLPLTALMPSFRGRRPDGAPPLTGGDTLHQLGLMIADRQAGEFALEIEWIGTY